MSSLTDQDMDPLWQDLDWAIGQMFIMGWDGTEVTPQIRTLIQDHHLGAILLTAKNLRSAEQTTSLVQELQTIAKQSNHPQPLLIALDQENGGVNSLFDEDLVCQFPSQMGIAATNRADLAYQVSKATAEEIAACGINLMLGPVLDVLSNTREQPLAVRATSDDPQEVSQYGIQAMHGAKAAGVATCGKHFPSYGHLDSGAGLEMPVISQTLEELSLSALVPFREAIATGSLDAVFVGGCRISNPNMDVPHACLSDQVVDELLRNDLGFQGVAISECLEMESLSHELGVQNGVVMGVEAGCDLILLCRAYEVQQEAIKGLKLGIENGIISKDRLYTSLGRVLHLKSKCTSWNQALNPPGTARLSQMHPAHSALSRQMYDDSVTVVRDKEKLLPLVQSMHQEEELLLLTPLVRPLPASALMKILLEPKNSSGKPVHHDRNAILRGEEVFRELGRSLARARNGKLLHTSYTENGVRPVHENLINKASTVIVVTADANRNKYQASFTKYVDMMCSLFRSRGQKKNLVVVAVSSPYDFAHDKSIGTYVCTYDFTDTAMYALVRALIGDITPRGSIPGTMRKARRSMKSKSKQFWLVEEYDARRDAEGLDELIRLVARASSSGSSGSEATTPLELASAASFTLANAYVQENHFVVRNSSTGALYGFVATYVLASTGIVGALVVDPNKRNLSIGRSLHRRAMRALVRSPHVSKVQLGTVLPGVFPGIPVVAEGTTTTTTTSAGGSNAAAAVKDWFAHSGWDVQFPRRLTNLAITRLSSWAAPEGLLQSMQRAGISFDLVFGGLGTGGGGAGGAVSDDVDAVVAFVAGVAATGDMGNPEVVVELYRAALSRPCGVVRAKGPDDSLLGVIIIMVKQQQQQRRLGSGAGGGIDKTVAPAFASRRAGEEVAGILAPVVPQGPQATLVLQGLALMGVRQGKSQKASRAVLSWVLDDMNEPLQAIGFEVLQTFEEITNSPENWSDLA